MEEGNRVIQEYFDDFVDAFSTFSGERVADKFLVPYMVKGQAEQSTVFSSLGQIAEYFQAYLDDYKSTGCSQCRYENLEVKWLGSECAVASVDWTLSDTAGFLVTSWPESYVLSISGDKAFAFATIDHAGE